MWCCANSSLQKCSLGIDRIYTYGKIHPNPPDPEGVSGGWNPPILDRQCIWMGMCSWNPHRPLSWVRNSPFLKLLDPPLCYPLFAYFRVAVGYLKYRILQVSSSKRYLIPVSYVGWILRCLHSKIRLQHTSERSVVFCWLSALSINIHIFL